MPTGLGTRTKSLSRFFAYGVIGGATFVIDLTILLALLAAGAYRPLSVALGFTAGLCFHFTANKWLNFRNFDRPTPDQLRTYAVVAVGCLALTVAIVEVLSGYFQINPLVAKLAAVAISLPAGFLGHKHLTFGPGFFGAFGNLRRRVSGLSTGSIWDLPATGLTNQMLSRMAAQGRTQTCNLRFALGRFVDTGGSKGQFDMLRFVGEDESPNWSDENEEMVEESSRDHFIDVATRRLCIDGLKPALKRGERLYCDFGCSNGWLLDDVSQGFPGLEVIGADAVGAGLKKLRRRRPELPLFQFDMKDIPFPRASLDAFSCLNVLEHIEDDLAVMSQLRRVLKPGGRGFIVVPACPSLMDFYDEVHLHRRRYTKRELAYKLGMAGFKIDRLNYLGFSLFPPFYASKKLRARSMDGSSMLEKRREVERQIDGSRGQLVTLVSSTALAAESAVGRVVPYPIGIRLYAVVSAPDD